MKILGKLLLIIVIICAAVYGAGYFYFGNHFIYNTCINGVNVSFKDAETVNDAINNSTPILKIVERNAAGEEVIETIDLVAECDAQMRFDVSDIIESQDRALWFLTAFNGADYEAKPAEYEYSEEKLHNSVAGLYCLQEENIVYPTDAHIEYNDGVLTIVPEENGCYIESDSVWWLVQDSCEQALQMGSDMTVNLGNTYLNAEITSESTYLADRMAELQDILDKTVTVYVDGYLARTISSDDVASYLNMNNSSFYVDDDAVGELARSIANEYYVSDYKYVDRGVLKARITSALLEDEDSSASIYYTIIVNGYVEVSISQQTLWYYENDVLIMTSPVVTGDQDDPEYYTPTGTFKVRKKDTDCVLRGDDYTEYVDYWIGWDSTGTIYGFHDASWRSEFGGDIYLTDPTHGCVNMPTSKIAELYKRIPIGAEVYIHN